MDLSDHRLRWPRLCRACAAPSHRSFGPVCAHATSTVGPAMLSVASTHTEPKSSIAPARARIIAATGEKSGLVVEHTCNDVSVVAGVLLAPSLATDSRGCEVVPGYVERPQHREGRTGDHPKGAPTNAHPRCWRLST
jgi:hypothetical protein